MAKQNLTKNELRAQRRAEREAAERAAAAAANRTKRLRILISAVAAALVVVAAAVAIFGLNGKGDAKNPATPVANSAFIGVTEKNGVLGADDAPLTVTEFIDLQCEFCAKASKEVTPDLVKNYVKTGKIKLQARTLTFLGGDSVRAATVAHGAQQQGRLWPFLESFFASQGGEGGGYVNDEFLTSVAKSSGVDIDKALEYANTAEAQDALNQASAEAEASGVSGTPTYLVARGDGKQKLLGDGSADLAKLTKALDAELTQ